MSRDGRLHSPVTDSNRRFSAALATLVTLIVLAALAAALVGCVSDTGAASQGMRPPPVHYVITAGR